MIRFFASHPTAANLLMLALAVLGLVSLPSLRRETFPEFTVPAITITVLYPGASPEAVEETIVQRVEDAAGKVENVKEIRSLAQEGLARVTVEMEDSGDIATFLADIKSEVDGIVDFPTSAEAPVIKPVSRSSGVVSVAVTGPMSAADLKVYCEQLKRQLKQYSEISQVEVTGFSDQQLQIRLKAGAVAQYGLSIGDLADTISAQSVDMPVGSIETRDEEIMVRVAEERRSRAELADLVVVSAAHGAEVRLGDIAVISDTFEVDEEKILFNGKRAGVLNVTKTAAQDILRVFTAVNEFVDKTNQTKPPGVTLTLTDDRATAVSERLGLLLTNAYQGLLLVFFSLWLFFSFRLAFWVSAGLPISVLGALFVMELIDYSLNMMTMMALLMALGLLMDDAIVLAENVASHRRRGKTAIRAAVDGVKEVSLGVLSSFATTAAIFVPLAFLDGTIGKVLLVIPVVLITVLSVSLIEAFCILPNHLAHMKEEKPGLLRQRFDAGFETLREKYLGGAVDFAVKYRYASVGGTIALFIVSIGLLAGGVLKFQGFPDTDGNTVQLQIGLPQGSPLKHTEEIVARALEALARTDAELTPQQPDGQKLVKDYSVRYNFNTDVGGSGAHLATISVDLLSAEERNGTLDDLLARWRAHLGPLSDVTSAKFGEVARGPGGVPISLRIQGNDPEELSAAAADVQAWLANYEGVVDLSSDLQPGKPEIRVKLLPGALSTRLNATAIARQLRAALSGTVARRIQVGTEDFEVQVQLARRDTDTLADLEYFQISIGNQKHIPLGTITRLEPGRGFSKLSRVDGVRTVTVSGDANTQQVNVQELVSLFVVKGQPEILNRHPSVRMSTEGEAKSSSETSRSMLRGFVIGLFGVFILLSFQFRSYIEPLVVLIAIPFALIGVIWGNLAMGTPFSLPGMLGFCALAGVVVNDSILLVEFIKNERRRGVSIPDAARNASRARFRAVMLTSVTTVMGLVPLLFETSLQARTLIPVATSIVFGTTTSMFLVLIVLPAMYTVLGDMGWVESLEEDEDELPSQGARSHSNDDSVAV